MLSGSRFLNNSNVCVVRTKLDFMPYEYGYRFIPEVKTSSPSDPSAREAGAGIAREIVSAVKKEYKGVHKTVKKGMEEGGRASFEGAAIVGGRHALVAAASGYSLSTPMSSAVGAFADSLSVVSVSLIRNDAPYLGYFGLGSAFVLSAGEVYTREPIPLPMGHPAESKMHLAFSAASEVAAQNFGSSLMDIYVTPYVFRPMITAEHVAGAFRGGVEAVTDLPIIGRLQGEAVSRQGDWFGVTQEVADLANGAISGGLRAASQLGGAVVVAAAHKGAELLDRLPDHGRGIPRVHRVANQRTGLAEKIVSGVISGATARATQTAILTSAGSSTAALLPLLGITTASALAIRVVQVGPFQTMDEVAQVLSPPLKLVGYGVREGVDVIQRRFRR